MLYVFVIIIQYTAYKHMSNNNKIKYKDITERIHSIHLTKNNILAIIIIILITLTIYWNVLMNIIDDNMVLV